MDGSRFDGFTRSLTASRRSLVAGALAHAGGWLSANSIDARRKRKHKKKKHKPKAEPNEYGCLEVGDPCSNADQCCSSICEGKQGKQTCRAHETGTCKQDGPQICVIDPPLALTCNNDDTCRCFGTTAGSIACTRHQVESCANCQKDADCAALGYPPGSVCAPFTVGPCAGQCESGTACLIPCGVEFPPPTE